MAAKFLINDQIEDEAFKKSKISSDKALKDFEAMKLYEFYLSNNDLKGCQEVYESLKIKYPFGFNKNLNDFLIGLDTKNLKNEDFKWIDFGYITMNPIGFILTLKVCSKTIGFSLYGPSNPPSIF